LLTWSNNPVTEAKETFGAECEVLRVEIRAGVDQISALL
jgi:hypothetical protein